MKPKTRFIKMFYKLPWKARRELILNPFGYNPVSLNVICFEVRNDTDRGTEYLKELGYFDTPEVKEANK